MGVCGFVVVVIKDIGNVSGLNVILGVVSIPFLM